MSIKNIKKPLSENIYEDINGYYFLIRMNGKNFSSLENNNHFKTLNTAKRARDKFRDDNNLRSSKKYKSELSSKELNKYEELEADLEKYRDSMCCFSCDKNDDSDKNPIVLCDFCDDGYHHKCHKDLCNINLKCIGKINFLCNNNCKKNILFNTDKNCNLCNSISNNNNIVPIICQAKINEFFNGCVSLQDENIIILCNECNEFKKNVVDKTNYENITTEESFEENINISKQFLEDSYRNIVSTYFIKTTKFSDCENNFLLKRQNNSCNICDTPYIQGGFENDHIITKKINGSDCLANRQYLCCACHRTIKNKVDPIFNEYIVNANNFSGEENINNISKIKIILQSGTLKNLIDQISLEMNESTKNTLNKKLKIYIKNLMNN
jgi:hypothetical protein